MMEMEADFTPLLNMAAEYFTHLGIAPQHYCLAFLTSITFTAE
jgi:hypothetical protein